jgi:hypothetical protein
MEYGEQTYVLLHDGVHVDLVGHGRAHRAARAEPAKHTRTVSNSTEGWNGICNLKGCLRTPSGHHNGSRTAQNTTTQQRVRSRNEVMLTGEVGLTVRKLTLPQVRYAKMASKLLLTQEKQCGQSRISIKACRNVGWCVSLCGGSDSLHRLAYQVSWTQSRIDVS